MHIRWQWYELACVHIFPLAHPRLVKGVQRPAHRHGRIEAVRRLPLHHAQVRHAALRCARAAGKLRVLRT